MITIKDLDVFLLSYNRQDYILEMIMSLKDQTVGEFEIKILDNGSTDNTKKVISNLNDSNLSKSSKVSNKKIHYYVT